MAPTLTFIGLVASVVVAFEENWLDADNCESEECSLELRQLRGQRVLSDEQRVAQQMRENKKYEVAEDDESG
eukprot:CAMPEP_0197651072 /NCGR_PEP_ID=MMETSP1338-20131121/31336_1 /TAXON_ID=43686 ORGANISM="Pelagodinium beii, Strain RCC1491" /NCGR_SAMPLE_ID=MMETSP1338 /ASSEMBLY_ACC=CAM_ASM_000754 /LENGTH=71 /DNA_ID=CAMNT_0043225623 /DNA_START=71 /DNA_END=282 /DNA_ORIENTATION=-